MKMTWPGHVARTEEMRDMYTISVGKPEKNNHLEDLGEDGR